MSKNLDTLDRAITELQKENRDHGVLRGSESLEKALEINQKALGDLDKAEKARMGVSQKTDTTLLKSSESAAKHAGQYAENAKAGKDQVIAAPVIAPERKPNIFQRFGNWVAKQFASKPVPEPLSHEETLQKNLHETVGIAEGLEKGGLVSTKQAIGVVESKVKENLEKSEQTQDAFIQQPKAAKVLLGVSEDDRRQLHGLRKEIDKAPPHEKEEKVKEARSFFGSIKKAFGKAGTSHAKDSEKEVAKKHDSGITQENQKQGKSVELD
jgi:hypothetical protein